MKQHKKPGIQKSIQFIQHQLQTNALKPGDRLPALASLAAAAGVSKNSMWKAVDKLKGQGILCGDKGHSVRVTPSPDTSAYSAEEDLAKPRTTWQRVKEQLKRDIYKGTYSPENRLPSAKELRLQYGVSFPTLKKALGDLMKEELIAPYKQGYITAQQISSKTSTAAIAYLDFYQNGISRLTFHTESLLPMLYTECARNGIRLEVIPFSEQDSGIVYSREPDDKPWNPQSAKNYLGFIYPIGVHASCNASVFRMLYHAKKPVAIFDELGGWNYKEFIPQNHFFQTYLNTMSAESGRDIARYLLGLGHKKIAFISSWHDKFWSLKRYEGLCSVYRSAGYPNAVVPFTSETFSTKLKPPRYSFERLRRAFEAWKKNAPPSYIESARRLLDDIFSPEMYEKAEGLAFFESIFDRAVRSSDITAWVCVSDAAAVPALQYLTEHRIPVPGRISLISFDDSTEAIEKLFSSYNFNMQAMAFALVQYLLRFNSLPRTPVRPVIDIGGMVVERSTTGKARTGS